MAVPFSNSKLRVPKGFQNILEGLAREVLRNQPGDIYAFGALYFENLLKQREGKLKKIEKSFVYIVMNVKIGVVFVEKCLINVNLVGHHVYIAGNISLHTGRLT